MNFSPSHFRGLILISVATAIAGAIGESVFYDMVPSGVRLADAAAMAEASETRLMIVGVVALISVVATIAVTVGLYRFRLWARRWNLFLLPVTLVLLLALGYAVTGGAGLVLYELSAMIWGAVTFASYFSPVAAEFERPPAGS